MQQTKVVVEKKPRMRRLNVVSLQLVKEQTYPFRTNTLRSPSDVEDLAREYIGKEDREHLCAICLNTKNKVVAIHTIAIGDLNSCIVHPREVLKISIAVSAASFVLIHNHPSGNCEPSRPDIDVTKRMVDASKLIGIEMLDHVIISDTDSYSMKEKGYI